MKPGLKYLYSMVQHHTFHSPNISLPLLNWMRMDQNNANWWDLMHKPNSFRTKPILRPELRVTEQWFRFVREQHCWAPVPFDYAVHREVHWQAAALQWLRNYSQEIDGGHYCSLQNTGRTNKVPVTGCRPCPFPRLHVISLAVFA